MNMMNGNDRKEFSKALVLMGEVYEKNITEGLLEIYFNILQQFSIEQFKSAVVGHLQDKRSGQFFPKPADIIRQIEGDDDNIAMAKWCEVRKAIQRVGYYQSVQFDDPVIMQVIDRMGGWIELCRILTSAVGYKEAEFIKLYKHYNKFPVNAPESLPGYHEISNRLNGFEQDIPKPIFIETGQRRLQRGVIEK
jgi:hypothetical protein